MAHWGSKRRRSKPISNDFDRQHAGEHKALNVPDSTIGHIARQQLLHWAAGRDVLDPAHWFLHLLRVRTKRHWDFIATAFDGLAACEPHIQRWHRRGLPVSQLVRLASAWSEARPWSSKFTRAISHPPTQEFLEKGCTESDYFYLLFQCQRPSGLDAEAQLGLRAWLLVKGLQLAERGNVADELLRQACTSLRLAAYEKRPDWAMVFAPLAGFTVNPYILEGRLRDVALAQTIADRLRRETVDPKHEKTLDALRALAGGAERRDSAGETPDLSGWPPPLFRHPSPASDPATDVASYEEESDLEPIAIPSEDLDETDEVIVGVQQDPDASPAEQEEASQTIHLLHNADARFLVWDWNRPTPAEGAALDELIRQTLASSTHASSSDPLTAALAELALVTGQSLPEVLRISLDAGTASTSIWKIDLVKGELIQQAPRRAGHWQPTDKNTHAIRPALQRLPWLLPGPALEALRTARAAADGAQDVGGLWRPGAGSCLIAFNRWIQAEPSTARLTYGSLAMALGTRIYVSSGDHVLARLASARSFAGMPAAAAYAAYTADEVAHHHPLQLAAGGGDLNAAGSLLDTPDDVHLCMAFRDLRLRLERAAAAADFVAWHNLLALYWDARLRAATGARPIGRQWTVSSDFDWERNFCFVDDKGSPHNPTGRLVPLPVELLQELRSGYVDIHLRSLRSSLRAEITNLNDTDLLFLLEATGDRLRAIPITHAHREHLGLEAPLPTNLMRHRLRTWLHRHDADAELVDSLLGHHDGATLTHGAYCMRTWFADAHRLRPLLARAVGALEIPPPPERHPLPHPDRETERPAESRFPIEVLAAPKSATKTSERKWRHDALSLVDQHLREKLKDSYRPVRGAHSLLSQLALLSEQGMDELAQRLCRTDKGLPAVAGIARFDVLQRLAALSWRYKRQPLNLRRRYLLASPEASPFTALAPMAGTLRQRLAAVLDDAFGSAKHLSKLSSKTASLLVVVDVAVTTGATHPKLMEALLSAREQLRLVTLAGEPYLEWAPHTSLRERPEAAVQRFRVSRRTAVLIGTLINAGKPAQHDDPALPLRAQVCKALGLALATRFDQWLGAICAVVRQDNAIALPGTVAALLDGRVISASLDHSDWIRLRTGRKAAAPWQLLSTSSTTELYEGTFSFADQPASTVEPRVLQDLRRQAADDFLKLTRTRAISIDKAGTQGRRDTKVDELESEIEHFARESGSHLGGAVRMLGLWLVHLLRLKNAKGYAELRASSAVRYFDALAPQFRQLAYEIDLLEMEGDEIGELYESLLATSKAANKHFQYERLRHFQTYVQSFFAVDECDWSSVGPREAPLLGAPGLIEDALYDDVLELAATTPPPDGMAAWQCTSFLVLARRFGLRGREVIGSAWADLQGWPLAPVICVRRRHRTRIKSPAAKRVVPLVYQLSNREHEALDRLCAHHTAASVGIEDAPLLGEIGNPVKRLDLQLVRAHLNRLLRAAAGRKGLSVHDLRHSFANCLWAAVEGFEHVPAWFTQGLSFESEHLRLTLLGRPAEVPTRRGAWTIARQLGHAGPSTSLRSYVHLLPEIADRLRFNDAVAEPRWAREPFEAVRLEDLPCVTPVRPDAPEIFETLTPRLALEAMKLLPLRGLRATEATMNLRVGALDVLNELIPGIERRLTSASAVQERASTEGSPRRTHARAATTGLLSTIRRSAYPRLRAALIGDQAPLLEAARGLSDLSNEERIAMVGPAGEISFWTTKQAGFIAEFLQRAVANPKRVALRAPKAQLGWAKGIAAQLPWSLDVEVTAQLPAVKLETSAIVRRQRVALLIDDGATGFAFNRSELIVALVCVISCATPIMS